MFTQRAYITYYYDPLLHVLLYLPPTPHPPHPPMLSPWVRQVTFTDRRLNVHWPFFLLSVLFKDPHPPLIFNAVLMGKAITYHGLNVNSCSQVKLNITLKYARMNLNTFICQVRLEKRVSTLVNFSYFQFNFSHPELYRMSVSNITSSSSMNNEFTFKPSFSKIACETSEVQNIPLQAKIICWKKKRK